MDDLWTLVRSLKLKIWHPRRSERRCPPARGVVSLWTEFRRRDSARAEQIRAERAEDCLRSKGKPDLMKWLASDRTSSR